MRMAASVLAAMTAALSVVTLSMASEAPAGPAPVTAFVLRRWRLMRQAEREAVQPIAAMTRWRVASLPGEGDTCWRVELARCRGGKPNAWIMETADGSGRLHAAPLSGDLAEVLGHGSPASRARAG
mgnify:CR=1 FL=1